MDFEELVDQDTNGMYCLVFQNRESLEIEEIQNIFSEFGKVRNVKGTGNIRSYHFVRYRHFDEIQKAIEGLKNHPTIKLAAHKKKKKNNKANCNTNQNDIENNHNNGRNYKKSNSNQFRNGHNNNHHPENHLINEERKVNNAQYEPISKCHDNRSMGSENGSVSIKTISNEEHSLKNETDNKIESDTYEKEIPNLVTISGKSINENNLQKKIIFDADEVVVGNIHPNFGASYILHLLDSFEPIAISNVNVVSKSGIRYCHVYFRTPQDSMTVERLFDQTDLSGQRLVVLRPCRLEAEAAC